MRVLLVEDDSRLAEAYRIYFEDAGCATRWVGRVDAALEQLAGLWPELVISDFDLPDGTGFEIVGAATVPVFVCTGRTDLGLSDRLIEAGARAVLIKPFSLPDLLSAMAQAMTSTGHRFR